MNKMDLYAVLVVCITTIVIVFMIMYQDITNFDPRRDMPVSASNISFERCLELWGKDGYDFQKTEDGCRFIEIR